jgi:hypothetical protein
MSNTEITAVAEPENGLVRRSTFECKTLDDVLKLTNALNETISVESIMDGEVDEPKTFVLSDIVIEPTEVVSDQTGEVTIEPRTVFIRKDGTAISTISRTIYRSVALFVDNARGKDWRNKIKVTIIEGKSRSKRRYFNVKLSAA